MKRLAALTVLLASLGAAAPLSAPKKSGPLEVTTVGLSRAMKRTLQKNSTGFQVVYDRKTGNYRVPYHRSLGIGISIHPFRFETKPRGILPSTLTFVVVGDDFESFQIASKGSSLKAAWNYPVYAETASFQAKGSANVKRWRTKPGTYFVVTHLEGTGEWKVRLTPAAMKLLRHPSEFAVYTGFDYE